MEIFLKENYLLGLVFKEGFLLTRILQKDSRNYTYIHTTNLDANASTAPIVLEEAGKEILKVERPYELYHITYTPIPSWLQIYPHVPSNRILLSLHDIPATVKGKMFKSAYDPLEERQIIIHKDLEVAFAFYNPPEGETCRPVLNLNIHIYRVAPYDPAIEDQKKLIDLVLAGKVPCTIKTIGAIDAVEYETILRKDWKVAPVRAFHIAEVLPPEIAPLPPTPIREVRRLR